MNRRPRISRGRALGMLAALLLLNTASPGDERYPASGLVLRVDRPHNAAAISCQAIPGYREAMVINVSVLNAKELDRIAPGTIVDFTLVARKQSAFAESMHPHLYQGLEPDPASARRLRLLAQAAGDRRKPLSIGDRVPDFTLVAQDGKAVTFSRFRGKLVALNFVYTRCALPNFCIRSSNNFATLEKSFKKRLGADLILLTITFDPVHDTPDVLKTYAARFDADPRGWHFLTGPEAAIRRVCDLFREDYFPDEGLMDHSLHTVIINRRGELAVNLEGNEFTAQQLRDLVETMLEGDAASVAGRHN